jgi:hypothetical protein
MPIEDLIGEMDLLEEATRSTIRLTEALTREREDMGQTRTYAAKRVALEVAKYMYQVTGNIPGLWTGENPSGPYAKAVLEIFDLLGIPPGSLQRAGEYATAKLKGNPEF